MYRPPGGSIETQQMCEQAHKGHQVAALEHNRREEECPSQHMEILGRWKGLLPPRGARTQLAGEPAPLLRSPGTEHGCQMHCNTAELIRETHVCVGLSAFHRTVTWQTCGQRCLCQHMVLLEHCRHGDKYTHADPWWHREMICVPTGEPRLTMEVLKHNMTENRSDYTITWWLRDTAGVQTGDSKSLVWQCRNVAGV